MFRNMSMFVAGSSALLLGCVDQPSQASQPEDSVADQALGTTAPPIPQATGPYSQAILHAATGIPQVEDSFGDFAVSDLDRDGRVDLAYFKRLATGTDATELHAVSAASGFQQFILHTGTGLGLAATTTGDLTLADIDRDGRPDQVFIKRRSTGTGAVEVHVLSAASGFQQFILHTGTGLAEVEDGSGEFFMADVDRDGSSDLVFAKSGTTGSGKVELHTLSAASGFQQFLQHTATALTAVEGALGNFAMADVDRDGRLDLAFLKRRKTGSGTIEVHVLSAASGFQQFLQHAASALAVVEDGSGDFTLTDINLDGTPDLVYIKRRDVGAGTIELHAFGG
jgi:hypothetical protein